MKRERLLRLADFLEMEVPYHQFDLGVWVKLREGQSIGECGTAGCACGWATMIPEFKDAGFVLGSEWSHFSKKYIYYPVFGAWAGYDAAQKFFGLDFSQAAHIFSQNRYFGAGLDGTPTDVATRIRNLVKEDESCSGS